MKKLLKLLFGILKWFVILSVTWVLVMRFVPSKTPLKALLQTRENHRTGRQAWIPIEEFPAASILAVLVNDDPFFWTHDGFFPGDVRQNVDRLLDGGKPSSGRRTISQQVARSFFTLGSETWFQEGLESWFTLLIEAFWGKWRILEAYLNISVTSWNDTDRTGTPAGNHDVSV